MLIKYKYISCSLIFKNNINPNMNLNKQIMQSIDSFFKDKNIYRSSEKTRDILSKDYP